MRSKLFAANWKMNLLPDSARALIDGLKRELSQIPAIGGQEREVMIAPPAILIPGTIEAAAGSPIKIGAQNMYCEDQGAFTGEISPLMLKAYGVQYVILGHSERRHIFGETDELINRKLASALRHGLAPILCVGETLEDRQKGRTTQVIMGQLTDGLSGFPPEEVARVTLAYEPVWAIGTGHTATPEQAQAEHSALRGALIEFANREVAHGVRILYGGSVTPDNVDSLMAKPDIDGALVGGASLKLDSFLRIVKAGMVAAN
jgi:triosephosphate isomerase (TIM)